MMRHPAVEALMAKYRPFYERWLDAVGFPGYEISDLGRVRGARGVLAPSLMNGYEHVSLMQHGVAHTARIAVLVCEAFHGPRPSPIHHAAHGNGIARDNRAGNLRWATPFENQADLDVHETRVRGERVFGAKLSEIDVRAIKGALRSGASQRGLANAYGVDPGTIHHIAKGKTWRHVQ